MNANLVSKKLVLTSELSPLDPSLVEAVRNLVRDRLNETQGPLVGFFAHELADALDVSPLDVIEQLRDITRRWWYEGQKTTDYRDMLTLSSYIGHEYVEIELHRDDCHKPLMQALQIE